MDDMKPKPHTILEAPSRNVLDFTDLYPKKGEVIKRIEIGTDRGTMDLKGKIRQSNWAVIIETEDGEMWINKHFIRHLIITDCEENDDD